jgi:hypothetical protein
MPKQLNKRVTHKDFQEYIEMASEVFATKTDMKNLATKSEFIKIKDEILISNDKLANKMDKILTEQTMQTNSYSRHDKEIKRLKDRVEIVERKVGLNPVS